MKTTKFLTRFSIAIILLIQFSYSCGITAVLDGINSSGGLSLIDLDLASDKYLKPFYYYSISHRSPKNEEKRHEEQIANIKDWKKYFNNRLSNDDIYDLIYKMDIDSATRNVKEGVISISKKKVEEFLPYLEFIRECEPYVTSGLYNWGEENREQKVKEMNKLIEKGIKLYNKAKTKQIKLRYAYQIVRLVDYSNQKNKKVIEYYKKYSAPIKIFNYIKYKTMYHYANNLMDKEDYDKYLQTIALIFDQYPSMMKRVLKNFSPDEKKFKKLLKQLKSKHRKETLWVMKSLKEDRIDNEPLKEIYKLKPNSLRLEVLLTRHIHKIEKSFLKSDIFFQHEIQQKIAFEKKNKHNKKKSFWEKLKQKYHQFKNKSQNKKSPYHKQALLKIFEENKILIIRDLMTFIDSSLQQNKVRTPELWHLYSGYLKIFLGEYQQANQSFEKGLKICKKDKIKNNILLVQNLLAFTTKDKISPKLENKLYQNTKWAKEFIHKKYNNHSIYDSIFVVMAKKYLHENQLGQGYLCLSKIDYPYLKNDVYNSHATSYDLEQFIVYLQKKKKTKWDRFLLRGNIIYKNILNYTAAIKELQNLNYKKSLSYLQKIKKSDSFWKILKDNVNLYYFPAVITDYFGNGGAFPYRFVDDPIAFIKKIISIQKQKNLSKAEKNYRIGKMFYDQSRWVRDDIHWDEKISKAGSTWEDEYNYYRSSRYNGFRTRPNYVFNFLNLSDNAKVWHKKNQTKFIAKKYFDKFLQQSEDKEKKAKVVILNFRCQNGFILRRGLGEKPEDLNFKGNPKYYDILHKKYSDTDYYKEFITECALFRKFVKKSY